MCGKFTQMMSWSTLVDLADIIGAPASPAEAIMPMRFAAVIRRNLQGRREAARMRWGLVPPSQRDPTAGTAHIHARAEGLEIKPTFRDAFFYRRGLIVVSSFNVAKDLSPTKRQQHVVTPNDGKPLGLAVIWERWTGHNEGELLTFAMVTVAANALIGTITDRMPAVIHTENWAKWLGEEPATLDELKAMLVPADADWQIQPQARNGKPAATYEPSLF